MGLDLIGKLIAGGVTGIGLIWIIWRQIQQGPREKERADACEGYIRSEQEARQIEEAVKTVIETVQKDVNDDKIPSDRW